MPIPTCGLCGEPLCVNSLHICSTFGPINPPAPGQKSYWSSDQMSYWSYDPPEVPTEAEEVRMLDVLQTSPSTRRLIEMGLEFERKLYEASRG